MVDELTLDAFRREALDRLQAPMIAYFDALDKLQAPRSGLSGLLAPVTNRIQTALALSRVKTAMRDALQQSHIVAAVLGNDMQALTPEQNARVQQIIAEQQGYMDGFMADLPQMTRPEALARVALYLNSIVQTISQIISGRIPQLPIRPGDERLICCSHGFRACKCSLRIVTLAGFGNFDVYWDVHASESCDSCLALSESWNPLRIRGGRIIGEPLADVQLKMLRAQLKELAL